MEAEERDLEAHFDQQAALGNLAQWYQDAVEFLKRIDDDHWWCTHTRITAGLAETLRYHDEQQVVRGVWSRMAQQLAGCSRCVLAYHSAQLEYEYQLETESAEALLGTLRRLDKERVAQSVRLGTGWREDDEVPASVSTALFEALSFANLLEDAEVVEALASTLLKLSQSRDLALADGGRYPGVYALMAHPHPEVRKLMSAVAEELGPLDEAADLHCGSVPQNHVASVLRRWEHVLQFDLFHQQLEPLDGRRQYRQPRLLLWSALEWLLLSLRPPAMAAAVADASGLVDIVAAAAVAPGTCQRMAAGCLRALLSQLQPQELFWERCSPPRDAMLHKILDSASSTQDAELHNRLSDVTHLLTSHDSVRVQSPAPSTQLHASTQAPILESSSNQAAGRGPLVSRPASAFQVRRTQQWPSSTTSQPTIEHFLNDSKAPTAKEASAAANSRLLQRLKGSSSSSESRHGTLASEMQSQSATTAALHRSQHTQLQHRASPIQSPHAWPSGGTQRQQRQQHAEQQQQQQFFRASPAPAGVSWLMAAGAAPGAAAQMAGGRATPSPTAPPPLPAGDVLWPQDWPSGWLPGPVFMFIKQLQL